MSGKSRHKRGKYSFQHKRKKERISHSPRLVQPPAAVPTHEPVTSPTVSVPSASVSTPKAKPPPIWHPYVTTELRAIGILAGIMLIILIVLALILS